MVGHEAFFNDPMASPNSVRLAPPRLDFRWRLTTQEAATQRTIVDVAVDDGWEESTFLESDDVYYAEPEIAPPPPPTPPDVVKEPPLAGAEPVAPPAPAPSAASKSLPPHIMLLKIAQMYKEEWRPVRIETSTDKSYAFLLPRGSRLPLKQAVKRREALIITLDQNGKVSIQDLRKTAPKRKDSWLKNIFGWF